MVGLGTNEQNYILLSDFDPIQFAWVDINVDELVKD